MKKRSAYHIAHLTTVHNPFDNRIFYKECTALSEAGFRVSIIGVTDREQTVDGIRVRALRRRKGRISRVVLGTIDAARKLRQVRPDVLHIHDPELIPLGTIWRLLTKNAVVYDAHENFADQLLTKPYLPRWARRPMWFVGRSMEALVNYTFSGAVIALGEFAPKFRKCGATLVQNYPWLRSYPTPTAPTTENTFVYVGAVTRIRGVGEMLGAIANSGRNANLLIAGVAEDQGISSELSSSPDVEYVGRIAAPVVPEFIARGSVGLALLHPTPSYSESKPTKVFEYMASGRPFIASNISYWRSYLGEDCGLFVDVFNPDDVQKAVDWMIDNPEKARSMGLAGRKRVESLFTFEHEAVRLVAVMDDLLRVHCGVSEPVGSENGNSN